MNNLARIFLQTLIRTPEPLVLGIFIVGALLARRDWAALTPAESKNSSSQKTSWKPAVPLLAMPLLDWLMLSALTWFGLSYGPIASGLLALAAVRVGIFAVVLVIWKYGRQVFKSLRRPGSLRTGMALIWGVNLFLSACAFEALYIEPFRLQTTHLMLPGPTINGRPLRILHISDLHVERLTRREEDVWERVQALQPDLIILTGDYVNIDYNRDELTWEQTHRWLSRLQAPLGVFAVTGTPAADVPEAIQAVFTGLPITLLQDQALRLPLTQDEIYLIGISNLDRARDTQALENAMSQVPADAYALLLYHTPDLIEQAARLGIDLYLSGHTHGGQITLPIYGALITASVYGKQYEAGQYQVGPTTLYVSRGVGMEGLLMPRARFFCPPEIELIELGASSQP